jgi:hypothetical protein
MWKWDIMNKDLTEGDKKFCQSKWLTIVNDDQQGAIILAYLFIYS